MGVTTAGLFKKILQLTAAFAAVLLLQNRLSAQELSYSTMCDASAGVAVDDLHFIAVNDEDNLLRIFRLDRKEPVFIQDLSGLLDIQYDDKSPEADLEGAARIGDVIYFISSHGRDKEGRLRKNRHRFFALRIEKHEENFSIQSFGRPYRRLLDDLVNDPVARRIGLKEAYQPQKKKDDQLRPKRRGVNIEGLGVAPDGQTLLIGFRNPCPNGKAMIIPLRNPERVLLQGEQALFGTPILLDLGGLGIRSIERHSEEGCLLIIAGSSDDSNKTALFVWDGKTAAARKIENVLPQDWTPESLFFYPNGLLQILSDDGTRPVINSFGKVCPCKEADAPERKTFRSLLIKAVSCND